MACNQGPSKEVNPKFAGQASVQVTCKKVSLVRCLLLNMTVYFIDFVAKRAKNCKKALFFK